MIGMFDGLRRRFGLPVLLLCMAAAAPAAEIAPSFQIPSGDGVIALDELRGKVVYVDFWASWCAPCRKSFPWMNAMLEKYGAAGLVVVGVNVDTDPALADEFLHKMPARFPIVRDPQGKIAERYELIGMPSSFLIDRKGFLRARHVGFMAGSPERIEADMRALLEEKTD